MIQARSFSHRFGWYWQDYLTIDASQVKHTLSDLRANNPGIEFRLASDESTEACRAHERHADLVHAGKAAA